MVICAYYGYKVLDNYGIYAVEVLGMRQLEATSLIEEAGIDRRVTGFGAELAFQRQQAGEIDRLNY